MPPNTAPKARAKGKAKASAKRKAKAKEIMLHETAVSWIRFRLARSVPAKAWEEDRATYTARLKAVCKEINEQLDVDALCRRLPSRIQDVVDAEGDRISK